MDLAQTQLAAVGIRTGSSEAAQKDAPRVARFQMALADEMDAFKRENNRVPSQIEIQQMINRLLLPVVLRESGRGMLWMDRETEGRMFEFPGMEPGALSDGTSLELNVQYGDIPVDERVQIEMSLRTSLGRDPTEDEVIAVYERYLLERY